MERMPTCDNKLLILAKMTCYDLSIPESKPGEYEHSAFVGDYFSAKLKWYRKQIVGPTTPSRRRSVTEKPIKEPSHLMRCFIPSKDLALPVPGSSDRELLAFNVKDLVLMHYDTFKKDRIKTREFFDRLKKERKAEQDVILEGFPDVVQNAFTAVETVWMFGLETTTSSLRTGLGVAKLATKVAVCGTLLGVGRAILKGR